MNIARINIVRADKNLGDARVKKKSDEHGTRQGGANTLEVLTRKI